MVDNKVDKNAFLKKWRNRWMYYMPDKIFLKYFFQKNLHYKLNLLDPQTFNEKIQWLKLYDRKSRYTSLVDKYEVKKQVSELIGNQYVIPTLGVWNDAHHIDFSSLPSQFVLKCTHDSGHVYICRDKQRFNFEQARQGLARALHSNHYKVAREWPYKNVKRRIIAEKYMEESPMTDLQDYKLMCFNGVVKCIFVCSDRMSIDGLKVTFFDTDWQRLPFIRHYPASSIEIPRPENLEKMIALAEILAQNIPFVRCDFYNIHGRIYFGELTFFPGGGIEEFMPMSWDYTLGQWITLPEKRHSFLFRNK